METVTKNIAAKAMQHVDAAEVGRALRGFGLNLSCSQLISPEESIALLLEMLVIGSNDDYAIIAAGGRGTLRWCGISAVRHGPGCARPPSRGGGMTHSVTVDRQAARVARELSTGS